MFPRMIGAFVTAVTLSTAAHAYDMPENSKGFIRDVGASCVDNWQSATCKDAIAWSNIDMVMNYIKKLDEEGFDTAYLYSACPTGTSVHSWQNPELAREYHDTCLAALAYMEDQTGFAPNQLQLEIMDIGLKMLDTGYSIREHNLETDLVKFLDTWEPQ